MERDNVSFRYSPHLKDNIKRNKFVLDSRNKIKSRKIHQIDGFGEKYKIFRRKCSLILLIAILLSCGKISSLEKILITWLSSLYPAHNTGLP